MFFVLTRYKTMLKTMLLPGAVSQSNLGSCLPDYSPQFGSNKTLLYFYYR